MRITTQSAPVRRQVQGVLPPVRRPLHDTFGFGSSGSAVLLWSALEKEQCVHHQPVVWASSKGVLNCIMNMAIQDTGAWWALEVRAYKEGGSLGGFGNCFVRASGCSASDRYRVLITILSEELCEDTANPTARRRLHGACARTASQQIGAARMLVKAWGDCQ
jgi:hypothetical protein